MSRWENQSALRNRAPVVHAGDPISVELWLSATESDSLPRSGSGRRRVDANHHRGAELSVLPAALGVSTGLSVVTK